MRHLGMLALVSLFAWIYAAFETAIIYLTLDVILGFSLSWTLVLLTAFILEIVEFSDLKKSFDDAN